MHWILGGWVGGLKSGSLEKVYWSATMIILGLVEGFLAFERVLERRLGMVTQ